MKRMLLMIALLMMLQAPTLAYEGLAGQDTAVGDEAAQLAAVSGMPVLSITTDTGELPVQEDGYGTMAVYTLRGGVILREEMNIEINERGNTSTRFPKKSYRVKIVDEDGEKMNYALVDGLRADDDWILNPMYTDTSKIREALAYTVWDMMNSSGSVAQSSRLQYAEVFINGEYWGLYGVQERIDRKQVQGNKRSGILYKVQSNHRPTVQELMNCTDENICQGFELAFAGADVENPWYPAASYMSLMNGETNPADGALSLENAVDYGLWAMLTQAHDCHFKNQFINCVYTTRGYVMYKIPWDLNNTFGDIWQNDREDINHTNYAIGDLVMDGVFQVLVDMEEPEINEAIRSRWQQLRAGSLTLENLTAKAYALFDPLEAAMERDTRRWPQSGMGEGNAVNIRDIEDFIREILPRVDAFVEHLGAA